MKLTKLTNLLVIALALSVVGSGCRKRPGEMTNIPGGRTQRPQDMEPAVAIPPFAPDTNVQSSVVGPTSGGVPLSNPDDRKDWVRISKPFEAYTVHFAFDSSAVQAADKSKVAAVATYLKANAKNALQVDGHCDERGTEEYNRSLGERRALALREELIRLGVGANLIDTVSFGKDRPKDPGHNEAAWKQNRRGEFLLEVPPASLTPQ